MILSAAFYPPVFLITRKALGSPLRRALCSTSLQRLSSNSASPLALTTLSKTLSPIIPTTVCITSFNLDRAFQSGPPSMSDFRKTDSVASANGHPFTVTPAGLANYSFPEARLKSLSDSAKTPVVLMACGSFSPVTFLHLRLFEMANDYIKFGRPEFEVVGGYLSPVSDAYKKAGLASAEHRLNMCEIACQNSGFVMVDPWEAVQKEYQPTANVLDHAENEINVLRGGIATANGGRKHARIILLAGADLIQTMSTPGVWSHQDLDHILTRYGALVVERAGTDIEDSLATLSQWRDNIWVVNQLVINDVSSTKVRLFKRRNMSIRYLIPTEVIEYIDEHHLFEDDTLQNPGEARDSMSSELSRP
ncbi:hypothetical protein BDR22DRAFT_886486 [Usnea florida]